MGNFRETEFKLLLTTLTVGVYSLTGLCSSVLYGRKKYITFAFLGIIVSVLGFLMTVGTIWKIVDFNGVWKSVEIFIILAFSIAHSSLLLLARSDKNLINSCITATIGFIIAVALILIYLVLAKDEVIYYRLLGVFAVLDVLGTIVTPILKKLNS